MTTVHWNFTIENQTHNVRLEYGTLAGREIWVDGTCILRGRKWFEAGLYHLFSIEGHRFELGVLTYGLTYSYLLLEDSNPILSDRDLRQGKSAADLLKSIYLRNLDLWTVLSQRLEIRYLPVEKAGWGHRHRLVGIKKGFLLIVLPGFDYGTNQEVWLVIIRHGPLVSKDSSASIISDRRIDALLGKWVKQKKRFLGSDPNATTISLPKIKHETGAELAERIQTFFSVVARQASPLNPDECDGPKCAHRLGQQVQLVMVNHFPQFLCQDCLAELPGGLKKDEQEYKNAPNNLDAGLVVGLGAALLGAVTWAAGALALRTLVGLVPIMIFVGMVKLMDKVKVKRSSLFLLSAGGLTIASVFLGNTLASFLLFIRNGEPLGIGTLDAAWNSLFEAPEMLKQSLGLTLFLVGIYFFEFWLGHRAALKQAFQPEVEVLPEMV